MNQTKKSMANRALFAACLLVGSSVISVQAIDDLSMCIELQDRQPVEVELNPAEQFANCFTIADSFNFTELNITSMSEASFMHQVNVYEVSSVNQADLIGTFDSNDASLSQISVVANGKPLAFKVLPTERSSTKQVKVQYLQMGTFPHVVIELYNQT